MKREKLKELNEHFVCVCMREKERERERERDGRRGIQKEERMSDVGCSGHSNLA